jgi:hypothetical protein
VKDEAAPLGRRRINKAPTTAAGAYDVGAINMYMLAAPIRNNGGTPVGTAV